MGLLDKESFIGAFDEWYVKYKDVLNERVHDRRIRKKTPPYMRPRLRGTYLCIRRNMKRLWTFYDYKDRVMPNTNNGLETIFADIKLKVRVLSSTLSSTVCHEFCQLNLLLVHLQTAPECRILPYRHIQKILEVIELQGFALICQIFWRCGRGSNPRPPA